MDYGATITSITIKDKSDQPVSIACGFDAFDDYFSPEYKANAPYFGCTVGRYSSQIKNAQFQLNGTTYQLASNCGGNNLHGGDVGFDKKIWKTTPFQNKEEVGLKLELLSSDGDEGFPGDVKVWLQLSLNNHNEIKLAYKAICTKDTPLSLTNHTYFNLSGFERTVEDFIVQVLSNNRLEGDDTGACTGNILDVTGTSEELREGRLVKDVHDFLGDGFENFYIFDNEEASLNRVAQITDTSTQRSLEVFTTEPCMLFYTGKYTSDELKGRTQKNMASTEVSAAKRIVGPMVLILPDRRVQLQKPEKSIRAQQFIN